MAKTLTKALFKFKNLEEQSSLTNQQQAKAKIFKKREPSNSKERMGMSGKRTTVFLMIRMVKILNNQAYKFQLTSL